MIFERAKQSEQRAAFPFSDFYAAYHHEPAEGGHIGYDIVDIRKIPAFDALRIEITFHTYGIGFFAFERPNTSESDKMRLEAEIVIKILTAKNFLP